MMINKVAIKLAASTLAIAVTMVGCTTAADVGRPMTASADMPKAERDAARYFAQAQDALSRRALDEALGYTEQAVELSPNDVGYRMLLADLYLKNGRFASAETSFGDVLVLNPGNHRAAMSLVLTQIAQGKTVAALAELDRIGDEAATADVGLAHALAGDPLRAIELLEPAARAADADGRVRQNLALAYALAGDWQKARVTAAQDVSPAELDSRMEHWAAFAQPASSYDQVATLLGVTPAEDAGQPTRLALAPAEPEAAYAEVEAPAFVEPAPQEAPVELAIARGSDVTIDLPAPVEIAAVEAVAAEPAPAPPPAPVITAPALSFAAAVESLTEPQTPTARAAALVADAPLPAFDPKLERSLKKIHSGRFVVQLGAFSSPRLVEKAWTQARKRYGFGTDSVPLSTTVRVGGKVMLHRLSVAGFDSQPEATRFCQSIKSRRGVCFVRATAGDAPVQWASKAAPSKA